jgi:hypothetical protein
MNTAQIEKNGKNAIRERPSVLPARGNRSTIRESGLGYAIWAEGKQNEMG